MVNKPLTETEILSKLIEKKRQQQLQKSAKRKLGQFEARKQFVKAGAFGKAKIITQGAMREAYIQEQQRQQRARQFQVIGSRAEKIENYLCGINEVPFLKSMESARMSALTPPDRKIKQIEDDVVRSFPD